MKNLVLHIRYLLTLHDCVVVPGWGALVVQHKSAELCVDNSILPPRRWLSFNSLLNHNDGMLAHVVMQAEGCSYDDAMRYINEQVASWHSIIKKEKSLVWDKVGRFVYQNDSSMCFEEADDAEINVALNLLQTVTIKPLAELLPALDDETDVEPSISIAPIKWYGRAWQVAASIAAIVVFTLFISTPIDNYEATNDYAGLVASEILGYSTDLQTVADCDEFSVDNGCSVVAEDILKPCENEKITPYATATVSVVDTSVESGDVSENVTVDVPQTLPRYILVVGSLPSRKLAEKQIAEFESMGVKEDIKIYESDGKYRLYVHGFSSIQQAQSHLASFTDLSKTPFTGMWICSTRQ